MKDCWYSFSDSGEYSACFHWPESDLRFVSHCKKIYCFCHQRYPVGAWCCLEPQVCRHSEGVFTSPFFIWEHQTITNTTFFFKETLPQLWEVYFHSVSYSFADFFLQKSVTIWEWEQPKVSVRLTFAWRAWNVIFKPSLPITSIFSLWFNLHHRLWQYICNAVLRTPHCPSVHHYWIRRSTLKMFTELLYSGYRMYIISKNISSWP